MDTYAAIRQMMKMLRQLDAWLAKAEQHAGDKSFDPNVFASARLAPDMYPLTRQVQAACDAAKYTAAYATGATAPSHPDTEATLPELHERIGKVLAWLEGLPQDQFAGAADRRASPAWAGGAWMPVEAYVMQVGLPNFYFHVTTAYDILRHNGLPVGKRDFLGDVPFRKD